MFGGEVLFAISEALKSLFWYDFLHDTAEECFYLKKRRKIEKCASNPRRPVLRAPSPLQAPVSLHNIPSSCKVNAAVMSMLLPLHQFYLQKQYYK